MHFIDVIASNCKLIQMPFSSRKIVCSIIFCLFVTAGAFYWHAFCKNELMQVPCLVFTLESLSITHDGSYMALGVKVENTGRKEVKCVGAADFLIIIENIDDQRRPCIIISSRDSAAPPRRLFDDPAVPILRSGESITYNLRSQHFCVSVLNSANVLVERLSDQRYSSQLVGILNSGRLAVSVVAPPGASLNNYFFVGGGKMPIVASKAAIFRMENSDKMGSFSLQSDASGGK